MSKQSPKIAASAKPRPRAAFSAAAFGNLRAATGEGQGEALRLLLADIDEDPDQPRTSFDENELASLSESIKLKGVIQPIVVRPPEDGRYMLAFGARRFRASKLAGVKDIPAVIRAKSDDDFAAQVIENQQRANLSNRDLAAAIEKLASERKTNKEIAAICALKDYQVAAFKQVANFPPELYERIDNADMRALYDLFRQWGKTPEAVITALPASETFITITEARRIIGGITGKPTGSIVLERPEAPAPEESSLPPAPALPSKAATEDDEGLHRARLSPVPSAPTPPEPDGGAAPVIVAATPLAAQVALGTAPSFIVRGKGVEEGRLVVDQRAERNGWALVRFAAGVEEIALDELRLVRIE